MRIEPTDLFNLRESARLLIANAPTPCKDTHPNGPESCVFCAATKRVDELCTSIGKVIKYLHGHAYYGRSEEEHKRSYAELVYGEARGTPETEGDTDASQP